MAQYVLNASANGAAASVSCTILPNNNTYSRRHSKRGASVNKRLMQKERTHFRRYGRTRSIYIWWWIIKFQMLNNYQMWPLPCWCSTALTEPVYVILFAGHRHSGTFASNNNTYSICFKNKHIYYREYINMQTYISRCVRLRLCKNSSTRSLLLSWKLATCIY